MRLSREPAAQPADQARNIHCHHGEPMVMFGAALLQCERHVVESEVTARAHRTEQVRQRQRHLAQLAFVSSGDNRHVIRRPPGYRARGGDRRRLLQSDVGVDTTEAEGADTGTPGSGGTVLRGRLLPALRHRHQSERRPAQIDELVDPPQPHQRRDDPVLEGEHRADQTGDARRRLQMADSGLPRAQPAPFDAHAARAQPLDRHRQAGHLDRIPEPGAGAVRFNVLRPLLDTRLFPGPHDDVSL